MPHPMALLSALLSCAVVVAQNTTVLPAACRTLPGNAALSMPLRWSHGAMQVRINATMLPAGFIGRTISGVRLRRPTFLREPAYPAVQRTLTVRGGFQPDLAAYLSPDRVGNRPANTTVLFGPAAVSVAATPAPGGGTSIGAEFLVIPFSTPLPVVAGNLFLEFEAGDAPMVVDAGNWVDAVWFPGGNESGYAVSVGNGACTTRSMPTELTWTGASGPQVGGTASLRLTGAAPGSLVFQWFGLDPQPRAATPTYFGWGSLLGALDPALAGCGQWAPLDAMWTATADAGGVCAMSFALNSSFSTVGLRVGAQAIWLDPTRPGLPLSISNGAMLVLGNIAVGNACSTAFFPGTVTWSPWQAYVGQMPVLTLEHN